MKIDTIVSRYVPLSRQRRLLLLFSLAWMADAAGVMLITFTLPGIMKEWNLSLMEAGTIASSTFIGMLLGALSSGFIADMVGRKMAMNFYLFFTVFFTVIDGFAPTPVMFMVFRFLAGVGYGGLMPSVNAYLSESVSINIRGRYLVLLEASWAVGSILMATYAVTLGVRFGWRSDYIVMGLWGLLFIPFLTVSESPKYVFLKSGKEGLEKVLNVRISEDIDPVVKTRVPIGALFTREHYRKTIMVWISWFVVSLVYYGLFIWLPKIFASSGMSEAKSLWFTFFMMLAQLPGYLSAAYCIEKIGRRISLAVYFFGTGVSALLFSLVSGTVSLIVVALSASFFCLGVWGLVYAYTPELFPTSFRGTANGSAGVMARIAGIIAPYFTALFMRAGKVYYALLSFAILCVVAGVIVFILGEETKGVETG